MARLFFIIVFLFTFLSTASANQTDYSTDARYQSIAEDFRTYSTCQALHQNLSMFIAIHYGIGANMNFPAEWLQQQRGLIQNIVSHDTKFGDKLELVINKLHEEYGFPIQGLNEQKRLNQSNTTQGIIFSISSAISNPEKATIIIKQMLDESKRCRDYQSKFNYED
tara:strand:- start:815 stop:1312 length:498 start_codon:yes stop_codon:yes gene_type:complete